MRCLTRAVGCGEVESGHLFVTVCQDADELTLVCESRLQACDGVGVDVTRNNDLLPWSPSVFLFTQPHHTHKSVCSPFFH